MCERMLLGLHNYCEIFIFLVLVVPLIAEESHVPLKTSCLIIACQIFLKVWIVEKQLKSGWHIQSSVSVGRQLSCSTMAYLFQRFPNHSMLLIPEEFLCSSYSFTWAYCLYCRLAGLCSGIRHVKLKAIHHLNTITSWLLYSTEVILQTCPQLAASIKLLNCFLCTCCWKI